MERLRASASTEHRSITSASRPVNRTGTTAPASEDVGAFLRPVGSNADALIRKLERLAALRHYRNQLRQIQLEALR